MSNINKIKLIKYNNFRDLEGNLVASSRQLTRILKSEEKISI